MKLDTILVPIEGISIQIAIYVEPRWRFKRVSAWFHLIGWEAGPKPQLHSADRSLHHVPVFFPELFFCTEELLCRDWGGVLWRVSRLFVFIPGKTIRVVSNPWNYVGSLVGVVSESS